MEPNWTNLTLSDQPHANATLWEQFFSNMDAGALLVAFICLLLLILVLVFVLLQRIRQTFRRWKQRAIGTTSESLDAIHEKSLPAAESSKRNAMSSCMIATLDEFDSLTPLIVTPGSLTDEEPLVRRSSTGRTSTNTNTTLATSGTTVSSHSPPPPRRGQPGRTYLVPLTSASRARPSSLPPEPPIEMTISTTTKSIGTIPEHTEESGSSTTVLHQSNSNQSLTYKKGAYSDLDIISIDRTSGSTLDRGSLLARERNRNTLHNQVQTAQIPYSVPAPSYHPPPPPCSSSDNQQTSRGVPNAYPSSVATSSPSPPEDSPVAPPISPTYAAAVYKTCLRFEPRVPVHQGNRTPKSPSIDSISSNLSSPMESSVGDSGSPLDTTGSIADLSDSIYLASESDNASDPKGKAYYPDTGQQKAYNNNAFNNGSDKSDSDIQGLSDTDFSYRRHLHRIEEESEAEDPQPVVAASKTDESLSALSRDLGSVVDSECNVMMVRSVSDHLKLAAAAKEAEGLI